MSCWYAAKGGQGRNRTADASLFRAALYQLSYLAALSESLRTLQFNKSSLCTWGERELIAGLRAGFFDGACW